MKDLLKNPEFCEALDMIHKQYIDQMYHNAGKQPPVPESLIPLSYADAKIQKGFKSVKTRRKERALCCGQAFE